MQGLSSPNRDQTHTHALEVWILNHWITREFPGGLSWKLSNCCIDGGLDSGPPMPSWGLVQSLFLCMRPHCCASLDHTLSNGSSSNISPSDVVMNLTVCPAPLNS